MKNNCNFLFILGLCFLSVFLFACSTKSTNGKNESTFSKLHDKPLENYEAIELQEKMKESFFCGKGLGETMLTVGTSIVFPHYLVVALGNAALEASGRKTIVASVLPEEASKTWGEFYDGVTSVPGKIVASSNDREFVDKTITVSARDYLTEREFMAEVF